MKIVKIATRFRLASGRPEVIFLLLVFVALPYLNSLNCSWHLDDINNIVFNTPIHLEKLSLPAIRDTLFAHPTIPGTALYRPVSCLSFALNWFWGRDNVLGYHVVNIAIHLATALFLYLTILLLLRSPVLNNRYKPNERFIAAFATLLWAVNPVQTQAVTYIVQRMASLSAMFFIISVWCYLKARSSQDFSQKTLWFFLCSFLAYVLAVGAKENAAILPLSLFLIELFFLRKTTYNFKHVTIFCLVCGILTVVFALLVVGPDTLYRLPNSYLDRDFTLWQRLLTEARIVLWYLSLLFYPSPFRLSIDHSVQLSTSLLSPPTTIIALATIAILIIASFFLRKKYPILTFAILFYLLNHAVESTVIPLELVFEHRNYLPSFFLFLPLALLIQFLLTKYKEQSLMYSTVVAFSTTLLLLSALGTIDRNKAWKTEETLWSDALAKSPGNARPYINLAFYYKNVGLLQKAFELCSLSLDKYSPTPWKNKLRAYNNMGDIMARTGNHNKAIFFFDQAMALAEAHKNDTFKSEAIFNMVKSQWLSGNQVSAIETITGLVEKFPGEGRFQLLYGEMLIALDRKEDGLVALGSAFSSLNKKEGEYPVALLDLSLVYGRLGNTEKASFFLNAAKHFDAPVPLTNICHLEYSIRSVQPVKAELAFQSLLSQFSWVELMAQLNEKSTEQLTLPLSYPLLREYVSSWIPTAEKE